MAPAMRKRFDAASVRIGSTTFAANGGGWRGRGAQIRAQSDVARWPTAE